MGCGHPVHGRVPVFCLQTSLLIIYKFIHVTQKNFILPPTRRRFFDAVHSVKVAKKTTRPHFLKNRPPAAFVAFPLWLHSF
jgi:hypothetical protein